MRCTVVTIFFERAKLCANVRLSTMGNICTNKYLRLDEHETNSRHSRDGFAMECKLIDSSAFSDWRLNILHRRKTDESTKITRDSQLQFYISPVRINESFRDAYLIARSNNFIGMHTIFSSRNESLIIFFRF